MMSQFGACCAKIRIYTNTPEAQETLQHLKDLIRQARSDGEQYRQSLFLYFHEEEQPDHTEYLFDTEYSELGGWFDYHLSRVLSKLNHLDNGSYACRSSFSDFGNTSRCYGAAEMKEVSLSAYADKRWRAGQSLQITLTMPLKGWLRLFEEEKLEKVVQDAAELDIATGLFGDESLKALQIDHTDITYRGGSGSYFLLPHALYHCGEEDPEKQEVPFDAVDYSEDDELTVEILADAYELTKTSLECLRNDFLETLEFLQQGTEKVQFLMHYGTFFTCDKEKDDTYLNTLNGYDDTSMLYFRTGINRFDEPMVKMSMVGEEPIILKF